jgi:hypothetical protein
MQTTINNNPVVIVILNARTKYTRVNDAKNIKKWVEKNPFEATIPEILPATPIFHIPDSSVLYCPSPETSIFM